MERREDIKVNIIHLKKQLIHIGQVKTLMRHNPPPNLDNVFLLGRKRQGIVTVGDLLY